MSTLNKLTTEPATIQMLDRTRGDLFAVMTGTAHYIMQAENTLYGSEATDGHFAPGRLMRAEDGTPSHIAVGQDDRYTPCRVLQCTTSCPGCGDVMEVVGNRFQCNVCSARL